MPNRDSTPGRPHLGGTKRTITTNLKIEALLAAYLTAHPNKTDSQAIRQLLQERLEQWVGELGHEP